MKQKPKNKQKLQQQQKLHLKQKQQQRQKQQLVRGPEKTHATSKAVTKKAAKGSVDAFLTRHMTLIGYLLLCFLVVVIFHNFLTGTFYYMFKDIGSDTINGMFPLLINVSNYIETTGFPKWSHAEGMGQNIMAGSLGNPFSWILYLAGAKNIPYALVWVEILKIILSYFIFSQFLKLLKLSAVTRILGALLFCFSGFMIVGGSWYQFSTETFFLALMLLAFERLYQTNSWYLFPLTIALMCMFQPFNLYLYGLFLIIYFLFRHFATEHPSWKKFISVTLKLAGFTLLGVLISSFILVANIMLLIDSPRVGGESGYYKLLSSKPLFFIESELYYVTSVMRMFANDLLGNGSAFRGWNNYLEAPMFYIGLFPLLLFPQFLAGSNRRVKIVSGIFLLIFIIPIIFPFFRYTIWLFTGDYFRGFSFFFSLSILLMALFSFNEVEKGVKVNLLILLVTLILCIALLWFPYTNIDQVIDQNLRKTVTVFLIGYALIFALYRFQSYRLGLNILLLLLVSVEVGYINYGTVNNRETVSGREFRQKTGYNDYTVEAMEYIHSHDKPFFRVLKDYSSGPAMHASINDAKVQGFYATSSYSSFNQKYYIRFLEETEIIQKGNEHQSRWAPGLAERPLLLNLASNKYLLSTNPNSLQLYRNLQYDSVAMFGNVKVFRNSHFVPLGVTYKKYIPMSDFSLLSPFRKEITMLDACVVEDSISDELLAKLERFNLTDTAGTYTFNDYFSDMDRFRQDTLRMSWFSENKIRGNIEMKDPGVLFFSIPYDRGWHAKIDDQDVEPMICNIGFMGFFLDPGEHSVELAYTPPYFLESMLASIFGLLIYTGLILGTKILRKKRIGFPDEPNQLPL